MQSKATSRRKELKKGDGSSGLGTKNKNPELFAIVESRPQNKKTILLDKSSSCENNSRKRKSSKTLGADSISSAGDLQPYWSESVAETSSQLWLPTETALLDLDLNSSNGLSRNMVEKSWFSTRTYIAPKPNLLPTCYPLLPSFLVESMDLDATIRKCKKIRFYPTTEQKKIFKKWFGTARYAYNHAIELLKDGEVKSNWKAIKGGILNDIPEWGKEIPYQVKSIAIRDACIAVSAAKKKCLITKEEQEVKFKNRHERTQSCYIPKAAISEDGVYHTLVGKLNLREEIPDGHSDSRLVFDNGRWFLCIPYKVTTRKSENQGRVVGLDPGVRSFISFYSPTSCGKLGENDIARIWKLALSIDKLTSLSDKEADFYKRSRIKKAMARLRWKIKDLINEMHRKVALFLVSNFDIMFLPSFETSEMTKRDKRKINSKTARAMLNWAHYRFACFLRHKSKEHGKKVITISEAYTSKTISWTGEVIENLGGRKFVKSKLDGQKMDRDLNGPRGIFLRGMRDASKAKALNLSKSGSYTFLYQ